MAYPQQYERHDQRRDRQEEEVSSAHVSLGSVKYAVGAVAVMMLGEKIKSPEQRYLVLGGLSAAVVAIDTAWRDHMRAEGKARTGGMLAGALRAEAGRQRDGAGY
jgi:hypothetical protein